MRIHHLVPTFGFANDTNAVPLKKSSSKAPAAIRQAPDLSWAGKAVVALGALSAAAPALASGVGAKGTHALLLATPQCKQQTQTFTLNIPWFEPNIVFASNACNWPDALALAAQQCQAIATGHGGTMTGLTPYSTNILKPGNLGIVACGYMCGFRVCQ